MVPGGLPSPRPVKHRVGDGEGLWRADSFDWRPGGLCSPSWGHILALAVPLGLGLSLVMLVEGGRSVSDTGSATATTLEPAPPA